MQFKTFVIIIYNHSKNIRVKYTQLHRLLDIVFISVCELIYDLDFCNSQKNCNQTLLWFANRYKKHVKENLTKYITNLYTSESGFGI